MRQFPVVRSQLAVANASAQLPCESPVPVLRLRFRRTIAVPRRASSRLASEVAIWLFITCWRSSHYFRWGIRATCFLFCAPAISEFLRRTLRCWGWCSMLRLRLLSWPAGKFSDRFSRSAIAAAGYFVFAIVYFVFALAPSQTGDLADHGFLWTVLCADQSCAQGAGG